jgi:K+-transporting ATPase KdpF subunit
MPSTLAATNTPLERMETIMDPMHFMTAIVAVGLFAYLLFAMLCPEKFS